MPSKSGRPLPPELGHLICPHLSRRDLTQVLRVDRAFFEATIPHVWRNVGVVPLLRLLSSSPPTKPSDQYFNRLYIYGRNVETLTIRSDDFGTESKPVSGLPPGQGVIAKYATEHSYNFLPNLETALIDFSPRSPSSHNHARAWAMNLIPATLSNLVFHPYEGYNSKVFETLTTRCQNLVRLEFRMPRLEYWDPWSAVQTAPPPQELTGLEFDCFCLNEHALLWISQMPNLQSLKLRYIPSSPPPELQLLTDPEGTKYPDAFKKLTSLSIRMTQSVRGIPELFQLWGSPIVKHLTSVAGGIVTFSPYGPDPSLIGLFFMALAAGSPGVCHLELNEGDLGLETDPVLLPTSVLAKLGALRLRVLKLGFFVTVDTEDGILKTIGSLWPQLEELVLEGTVIEPRELFQMSTYLPKLHQLQILIPVVKPSPEPLSDALKEFVPSKDALRKLPSLPKLVIDFNPTEPRDGQLKCSLEDQDFLARVLVGISSGLRIASPYHSVNRGYFRERVSWYLSAKMSDVALETE